MTLNCGSARNAANCVQMDSTPKMTFYSSINRIHPSIRLSIYPSWSTLMQHCQVWPTSQKKIILRSPQEGEPSNWRLGGLGIDLKDLDLYGTADHEKYNHTKFWNIHFPQFIFVFQSIYSISDVFKPAPGDVTSCCLAQTLIRYNHKELIKVVGFTCNLQQVC